jgi:electron transfer flavoprotein beta subunit
VETVRGNLPMVVTVNGSAAPCRPRHAKLTLKYKHAMIPSEREAANNDYTEMLTARSYLNINEWGVSQIEHDPKWLGLSGSPTKVKQIESVVFTAKESKKLTANDSEIDDLMKELITNHTIG